MSLEIQGNTFREDELVTLSHFDKREGRWINSTFPKISGRLRLAHEVNDSLSIATEIVRYDDQIAVVKATTTTVKGEFPGLGTATAERDRTIAPAILELAETRAIARSLRFAGYGVEYCGAEEVSHIDVSDGYDDPPEEPKSQRFRRGPDQDHSGGNGGNGGDSSRITNKQLNYIVNLGKNLGLTSKDLDQETVGTFGVKLHYLNVKQGSDYIDTLRSRMT